MPVPAVIVLALLAHVGGPFMAVSTPPSPEMAISITDDAHSVNEGQRIRYHVTVSNPTAQEVPVTVRLTLPPSVTAVQANDATVVAGAVAWKKVIAGGETRTYSVAGTVSAVPSAEEIEVQACLYESADAPALMCATDRNTIAIPPDVRQYAWPAAIVFALLAIIGALWLYRKVNPELLTPANAGAARGEEPAMPGGAPSG